MLRKRGLLNLAAAVAVLALGGCSSPAPLEVVRAPAPEQASFSPSAIREALPRIEEATSTRVGLSLYDGTSPTSLGTISTQPAWSTIKIPVSFAALASCDYDRDYVEELVARAIENSDNDATDAMWACLDAAGGARELVGAEVGAPASEAWGRTPWSFESQARYAWGLSLRDDEADAIILNHMRHIEDDQRWGLGALDIPFKGGWGDVQEDGSWQSRQMGIITLGGKTHGIAIGATSASGSFEDTTAALDMLAKLIAQYV